MRRSLELWPVHRRPRLAGRPASGRSLRSSGPPSWRPDPVVCARKPVRSWIRRPSAATAV